MNTTVRRSAAVVLLAFAVACGGSGPTAPSGSNQPPPLPSPFIPPAPNRFPLLSGPSRTFVFERGVSAVRGYTSESRFVLYDNGAFELQFAGNGAYRGGYTNADRDIIFDWE